MRGSPLGELVSQLESLDPVHLERTNRIGGLEVSDLLDVISKPKDHTVDFPDVVEPCRMPAGKIHPKRNHGLAYCFFFVGGNLSRLRKSLERISDGEKWIVVNPPMFDVLSDSLNDLQDVTIVSGFESFILTPHNQLMLQSGSPMFHSCGTGDVFPALTSSGVITSFLEKGGTHVVVDVGSEWEEDDRSFVEESIDSEYPVCCAVSEGRSTGEILCRHEGIERVVDERTMSWETPKESFMWRTTGKYVIRADLDFNSMSLPWHRTRDVVGGKLYVTYQRFISDMTSHFQTKYFAV